MSITDAPFLNGVNVGALLGAREALSEAPEAAEFQWRATCTWINGTHSRSTVSGFSGLGQEHSHKSTFEYDVDHPEVFASEDMGSTPVEMVLVGLASCLTAGVAAVATNRDIALGILGADPEVRNGFNGIEVTFEIDADASADDIRALVAQSQKRSAVYDIITNPSRVTVNVAD
jgi:uncharacterized OsmC-like protein